MVELTEIPTMKNENVFDHINHLANIAKTEVTRKLFRKPGKLKNITAHQFLDSHICKDSYYLKTSEEDELRNECLIAENRKLL